MWFINNKKNRKNYVAHDFVQIKEIDFSVQFKFFFCCLEPFLIFLYTAVNTGNCLLAWKYTRYVNWKHILWKTEDTTITSYLFTFNRIWIYEAFLFLLFFYSWVKLVLAWSLMKYNAIFQFVAIIFFDLFIIFPSNLYKFIRNVKLVPQIPHIPQI